MRDRIVCLVGPSGSGKTTIAKRLEQEGYNVIKSYTTRKPRHKNEWGHIFATIEDCNEARAQDKIIAYQKLYDDHYWATDWQYKGKGTSIYAVDPGGLEQVKYNVKDAEIIVIFLMCDADTRINRMLRDGRGSEAIMDRLVQDEYIFIKCRCDYVVDANIQLKRVLNIIKQIIREEIEL